MLLICAWLDVCGRVWEMMNIFGRGKELHFSFFFLVVITFLLEVLKNFYVVCFFIIYVNSTRLCKSTWGHCSIYNRRLPAGFSYRRLYLQLDEGSLTFNANPQEVIYKVTPRICSRDAPTVNISFVSIKSPVSQYVNFSRISV